MEYFGSADAVFHASLTELEGTGIKAVSAQSIATGKSAELAREEIARAAGAGVTIVSSEDAYYPARLKEIYDPPLVLYVRGDPEILTRPGIAMVGTRHPTPYGSGMAERLACDLAAQGLVIISGMARGVDTASHRGAITAKGKTVAVLGTGVDVIYPKENSRLAEQITRAWRLPYFGVCYGDFRGAAEFSHSQPDIERDVGRCAGGRSSGIFRNANYGALRTGAKPRCFRGPGNVTNKNSWGPNTLIKQGAKLVATWEDVWEDLPAEVKLALTPPLSPESGGASSASLFPDEGLPPHEKRILSLLKADEATHIDELVERLENEMSSSEIFAALFELELTGKVRQMPGKNFVKSF